MEPVDSSTPDRESTSKKRIRGGDSGSLNLAETSPRDLQYDVQGSLDPKKQKLGESMTKNPVGEGIDPSSLEVMGPGTDNTQLDAQDNNPDTLC